MQKQSASKIVFVNRFFFPDHSATSQLLSDLAFKLALSTSPRIVVVTSRQLYDSPAAQSPARENICGVEVIRVPGTRFGRGKLIGRALDYLSFYFSATFALFCEVRRSNVIVAKTDPPLISVFAGAVALVRGATLVNWLQDLFPEVACALAVSRLRWFGALLRRLRDFSLRGAVLNIAIGSLMAKRIASLGISTKKVRTVHNWANGKEIVPWARDENPLRQGWGLDSKFVVGYSGNMGRAHEFQTILGAIDLLSGRPDIMFLFIGSGAQRGWLEAKVKSRSCSNVIFKPYQSRDQLKYSLGVPDVHLISLRPEMEGLIVPSKFYGIAAAGRPAIFVGDPNGEVPGILRSCGIGVAVPSGDVKGLVHAIVGLKEDSALAANMGFNARQVFEREYDKAVALQAWEQLLKVAMAGEQPRDECK